MTDKKTKSSSEITSVVAKEEDGNIQITFTVPFDIIEKSKEETVKEMANDVEVAGFRKGKAPLDKVKEKIDQNKLIEHALGHILPKALSDAINTHKLRPAIYPKYELISAKENEAWQIKATTCELPEIVLPEYKRSLLDASKKAIKDASGASKIAVSSKDDPKAKTPEEKEGIVIKTLLEIIKIKIPKILIEEEVSGRLSNLLARLEKLGLALEGYLSSMGKSVETMKSEYETQAKEAISLDLILSKIAEVENIKVDEKDLQESLKVAQNTNPDEDVEGRKRLLESILKRRQALGMLVELV